MNIDEIAKLANVSKTTVSRVLNNKPDVHEKTRKKIQEIIAKYDYEPNVFAKAISKKESRILGLVIPYKADYIFSNFFYEEMLKGISTEVNNKGYYLLFCYTIDDSFIKLVKQKIVDGFILISPGRTDKYLLELLNRNNIPFVATSKIPGESNYTYVDVDNFYGAKMATEHLISLGHKKIGFIINGPESLASSTDRLEGYKYVLAKNDIEYNEDLVKMGNTSINSGFKEMEKLLPEKPSAVFVANDMMAIGAMKAIKKHNMKIPDDISVVGFDDIALTEIIDPPLTTIRQPSFKKGVEATTLLIKYINEGKKPEAEELKLKLITRESSGYCKEKLKVK